MRQDQPHFQIVFRAQRSVSLPAVLRLACRLGSLHFCALRILIPSIRLCKQLRRCRQAEVRGRYLIVINLLNNRSARKTAAVLGVHNTTVSRLAHRCRDRGEWGLGDAREDNGQTKLDDEFLAILSRVARATPQQYG
jgi:hypothetical protein